MDQLSNKILINLIPQITYAGFDNIRLGAEVIIPDMFHDHGFGNDPTGVAHQIFEQGELERLQGNFLVSPENLTRMYV
jgi:hypothetical protein